MFSNAVNSMARWLGLALLMGLVLPALAQRSIEYSTPAEDDAKAPESVAPAVTHKTPSAFNAPKSLFGNDVSASFDDLPRSPVPNNNRSNPQWRKAQEDQKNWALMTPQEILGVPTPESILGISSLQDDTKLTSEERFLKRQDQPLGSSTNGWQHQDVGAQHQGGEPLTAADDDQFDRAANGAQAPRANAFQNLPLSGQDPSVVGQSQRDTLWDSPFASPTPLPTKPTTEQLQGMDRFRALLAPTEKAPAVASYGTPAAQPLAARDPNFQAQPAFNPAGAPAKALRSDLAKPTGLMPLAGVSGPAPVPAKRAPLVKPPPWMTDQTADSTPAQRRF
jgi:hypothetical protein